MLPNNEFGEFPVIFLEDEGVFAIVVQETVYFTTLLYYKDGISYEVHMENGVI